tara:strand:+ start:10232 stop:10414 length:183 start_codon:yes stop_codon:yes gene_type:complete
MRSDAGNLSTGISIGGLEVVAQLIFYFFMSLRGREFITALRRMPISAATDIEFSLCFMYE